VVVVAFGMLFVRDGGVFVAGVLDMRHVVGMGGVFPRLLGVMALFVVFVVVFVMTLAFDRLGRADRRRCGHVGLRFCNRSFAGSRCVVVMTGRVVILMLVRLALIAILRRMVMLFVVVMDGIGVMFTVVCQHFTRMRAVVLVRMVLSLIQGLGRLRGIGGVVNDVALDAVAMAAPAGIAMARAAAAVVGAVLALFLGLAMRAFVGLDQRLTVGDRDLIVVGMDFTEGEEAVAVAAIFDERRLQ